MGFCRRAEAAEVLERLRACGIGMPTLQPLSPRRGDGGQTGSTVCQAAHELRNLLRNRFKGSVGVG